MGEDDIALGFETCLTSVNELDHVIERGKHSFRKRKTLVNLQGVRRDCWSLVFRNSFGSTSCIGSVQKDLKALDEDIEWLNPRALFKCSLWSFEDRLRRIGFGVEQDWINQYLNRVNLYIAIRLQLRSFVPLHNTFPTSIVSLEKSSIL